MSDFGMFEFIAGREERPELIQVPIEVLKNYSTFNTYDKEPGVPYKQIRDTMARYENVLKNEGWHAFHKPGDPPNYPTLAIGRSGTHAVLNGHHRLWAADKLGLTHVPVQLTTGEDDDWAKEYGRPVEPFIARHL